MIYVVMRGQVNSFSDYIRQWYSTYDTFWYLLRLICKYLPSRGKKAKNLETMSHYGYGGNYIVSKPLPLCQPDYLISTCISYLFTSPGDGGLSWLHHNPRCSITTHITAPTTCSRFHPYPSFAITNQEKGSCHQTP